VPSDKYSIAWFKHAECVARGEKERALGVYRLLSYSFDDQAFASQLAGDLLRSFDDNTAIDQYHQAAQLYQKAHRFLESAAVYEHLIHLIPDKELYLINLVELYTHMHDTGHAVHHMTQLLDILSKKHKWDDIHDLISKYDTLIEGHHAVKMYKKIIFDVIDQEEVPHERICSYIEKTIELLLMDGDDRKLQRFLSELKACNESYYQHATKLIEEL
jgi:hypothetical protein